MTTHKISFNELKKFISKIIKESNQDEQLLKTQSEKISSDYMNKWLQQNMDEVVKYGFLNQNIKELENSIEGFEFWKFIDWMRSNKIYDLACKRAMLNGYPQELQYAIAAKELIQLNKETNSQNLKDVYATGLKRFASHVLENALSIYKQNISQTKTTV